MASQIDPTKPIDGVPAIKADLRSNLQAAKAEIEALQSGKTDLGHQHGLADITDPGALASKDSVAAGDIDGGAVTTTKIAGAAVVESKIADAAVTQSKIAGAAVIESKIADAAVTQSKIADAAVTQSKIAGAAVTESKIADAAVTQSKIAGAAVIESKIADSAVTQNKIADAAVTQSKIADGAITQGKIAGAAVTEVKIASGAVTESKIAGAAVTESKIADGAITQSKIADAAISQSKIAANAVGATQLQDGIPISMQGALLSGAELVDYAETSPTVAISAGALTIDLDTGSVFDVVLTANVTSLNLASPPAAGRAGSATLILRQDATGGRTVAWPSSVRWAGGTPPVVSPAANAVDIYAFITRSGGASWFGFPGGQDFS
jgi:hypothetical protein